VSLAFPLRNVDSKELRIRKKYFVKDTTTPTPGVFAKEFGIA
jgi:hypothetical protein